MAKRGARVTSLAACNASTVTLCCSAIAHRVCPACTTMKASFEVRGTVIASAEAGELQNNARWLRWGGASGTYGIVDADTSICVARVWAPAVARKGGTTGEGSVPSRSPAPYP